MLTDNGKAFTDRLFGSPDRQPTGTHEFDQLCEALGIEHRLTKPGTPQTNGMVERFNGRISDILKTHHFLSGEDLAQTLPRYVFLYNNQLPQSALGSQTPTQTMQKWFISNPEIFHRNPDDQPGCDSLVQYVIQDVRGAIDPEKEMPPEFQIEVVNAEKLKQALF